MVKPFWRKGSGMDRRSKIIPKNNDGLTWYKDLGLHAFGEFSMAMTQANTVMEDQYQIESGPLTFNNPSLQGTFLGVYDGHGGPEASGFIADNIFTNLKKFASQDREISENVIKKAYAETDEDFLVAVKKQWRKTPQMASVGSCCLTGVICNGLMYIANAGDSRAVLGRTERDYEGVIIKAVQLSEDHNANVEEARKELWSMHPNDPNILVMKHRTWRVKGVIQVTRSMGDAYLKKAEFNREPLLPKFRLEEHFNKPILRAEPSVTVTRLSSEDEFIILASDGLWEQLSNQEAVDIVYKSPRQGIARRLIKAALKEAAKKREMRYSDMKEINTGVRRHFHDDITVIVVYLKPLNG